MKGVVLRDYFAAKAMQGLLTSGEVCRPSVVAARAYETADSMIAISEGHCPEDEKSEDDNEGSFQILEINGDVVMQISIGSNVLQSVMPRDEIERLIHALTNVYNRTK